LKLPKTFDDTKRREELESLKLKMNPAFLATLVDGERYIRGDLFRNEPNVVEGVDAAINYYTQEFKNLKTIPSQKLFDIHPRDIVRFLK
jgi:hypothetical protein